MSDVVVVTQFSNRQAVERRISKCQAVHLMMREASGRFIPPEADLLEVHGVRQVFIVPALIVFFKDFALPAIRPRPTRRAIYERDEGRCSYCGRMLMRNEATIDHVVPKSRGGADGWTNLVLACEPCNTRKGDRTPGEAGMSLHTRPRLPKPRWDSR